MATTELNTLMRAKNVLGNNMILYPITKVDNVDGLDEKLASKVVSYSDAQQLTDVQQSRARQNIGAGTSSVSTFSDLTNITPAGTYTYEFDPNGTIEGVVLQESSDEWGNYREVGYKISDDIITLDEVCSGSMEVTTGSVTRLIPRYVPYMSSVLANLSYDSQREYGSIPEDGKLYNIALGDTTMCCVCEDNYSFDGATFPEAGIYVRSWETLDPDTEVYVPDYPLEYTKVVIGLPYKDSVPIEAIPHWLLSSSNITEDGFATSLSCSPNDIVVYNMGVDPYTVTRLMQQNGILVARWCNEDVVFHGVVIATDYDNNAIVRTCGAVTLEYSGDTTPTVGPCELVADGNGYVKVLEGVEGNFKRQVLDVDTTNHRVTFMIQGYTDTDTTYSAATTSAAGLMSSSDKSKLDGIASGANAYTLPAAGSSLGGVKTGGDVTVSNGVITVNDDSHNHVISNVDGLQSALDGKATLAQLYNTNVTTSGTGAAYTATISAITTLTAGISFVMTPNVVSTSTQPTLNVNGLGAKYIRRRLSNGTSTSVAGNSANWLGANKPVRVTYDGTYWIVDIVRPSATDIYGTVPIASGGTGASTAEGARTNLGLSTENWTFTLEDGSTVTKAVYVG